MIKLRCPECSKNGVMYRKEINKPCPECEEREIPDGLKEHCELMDSHYLPEKHWADYFFEIFSLWRFYA